MERKGGRAQIQPKPLHTRQRTICLSQTTVETKKSVSTATTLTTKIREGIQLLQQEQTGSKALDVNVSNYLHAFNLVNTQTNFVAGKTKQYFDSWSKIT